MEKHEETEALSPLPRPYEGKPAHNAWPEEVRQRAIDLAIELKSATKAAAVVGVPARTVCDWVAEAGGLDASAWDVFTAKELEDRIEQVLARIGPEQIDRAGLRDLAVTAGILLDKRERLLPKTRQGSMKRLRVAWKGGEGAVEVRGE